MTNLKMQIESPAEALYVRTADSKIYRTAKKSIVEEFGRWSMGYNDILERIDAQKATGSNLPFVITVQGILPKGQRVATLEDMTKIGSRYPGFSGETWFDIPEIILSSDKPVFQDERYLLESLMEMAKGETYSPENPLRISGIGMQRTSDYSFIFCPTEEIEMRNDKRFSILNNNKKVDFNGYKTTARIRGQEFSHIVVDKAGGIGTISNTVYCSTDKCRVLIVDSEGVDFN